MVVNTSETSLGRLVALRNFFPMKTCGRPAFTAGAINAYIRAGFEEI